MSQANENRAQPQQRWVVRVYLISGGDPQVYENVKHMWWSANYTVLELLHYYPDGSYRYENWPREHVYHYTRTLDEENSK